MNSTVHRPAEHLRAEIAVVGSGPGGAVTACTLAEAGRDVLLLEEGPYYPPNSCVPFSLDEMTQKYRNGGLTVALGRMKVAYVEGRCVGGGSEINSGLYHRIPAAVLHQWSRDFQVEALTEDDLLPHYEACERELSVSRSPARQIPLSSVKLHEGARQLNWKAVESQRCFKYDAQSPTRGFKQSMTRTYIPRALQAGCGLLPQTMVRTVRQRGQKWILEAVHSSVNEKRALSIEADTVFVAGGAIQTPALLRRSGIRKHIGNSLQVHPTIKVLASFAQDVNDAAMAVPVHQVKEFAPRCTFGCSISTLPHLGLGMLDHGQEFYTVEREPMRTACYYAMLSSAGSGTIRILPFFRDPLVRYRLTPRDQEDLASGLRNLCRLLFTAGARILYPVLPDCPPLHKEEDLDQLPTVIDRAALMTIHLFSSCPMGENRERCATDSFGRVHGVPGLHLADASLLCTSPSVNPQGAIMAVARRNVFRFLGRD